MLIVMGRHQRVHIALPVSHQQPRGLIGGFASVLDNGIDCCCIVTLKKKGFFFFLTSLF